MQCDAASARIQNEYAMSVHCLESPAMRRWPYRQQVALVIATGLVLAVTFGPRVAVAAEPALKQATLMPLWSPQAQFAGYYVALDRGMYARHGIDLKIASAGPGQSPARSLEDGTVDFAVLWLTTALEHRSSGARVVNLAQVVQRSSMMLVARKSSGIRSIADMNGKKVGLWGGDLAIPPRILFGRAGVTVHEIPQSHTVNLFLRGGIDVASAMWFNEYHTILNAGVDAADLSLFFLRDEGLDFPEDGLYALESTIVRDPALVDEFAAASLEGWRYAFAHPDEALDIVIKHMLAAHVSANRMHQKWMLRRMQDLVLADGDAKALGILKEQEYRLVADALLKDGLIKTAPDFREFVRRRDAAP
jgi:NitT/TauT family transport system substrate-binding protein